MSIQWFPGHMTAAKKKAEEALETNDLVIEVLDARIPGSSTNPMIDAIAERKSWAVVSAKLSFFRSDVSDS